MRRIRWTEAALADLEEIAAYLNERDPAAAPTITTRLHDAVYSLQRMPYRGRDGREPGTRQILVQRLPYWIVYKIRYDAVVILGIVHAARLR